MIETKQKFCINNTRSGRLTVFVVAHSIGRRAERKQETLKVNSVGIVPIPHVLIKTRRPVTRPFTEGGGWISAQGWALRARPLAQSFLPGLKSRRKGPIPHARFNCKNRWRRRWRWSPSTRSVPLSKPDDAPWESLRILENPFHWKESELNGIWNTESTGICIRVGSRVGFTVYFISRHLILRLQIGAHLCNINAACSQVRSDGVVMLCNLPPCPPPSFPPCLQHHSPSRQVGKDIQRVNHANL